MSVDGNFTRVFTCEVCCGKDRCTSDENVCPQCVANARLGAMVRAMPKGTLLGRPPGGSAWWFGRPRAMEADGIGDSPEEALEKAGVRDG